MPESDEAAARGFTDCLDRWESAGFDYGVVEETNTRTGIGVGGLRRQRDEHGEQVLNLYYRLAGAVHGRGLATEAARAWTAHALEWLPDLPGRREEPRGEPAPRCAPPSRRACRRWAPRTTAGRGRDGLDGAAGAAGRGPRLVRRGDPRVAARPVVRGQRPRRSGGVPAGRTAPPGRAGAGGARGGDGRRQHHRRAAARARPAGRGRRVLGRRPQPAARAHAARPTGS